MGALSFVLPFTVFVYLLPSVPNIDELGEVATTALEQLRNFIDFNALNGIHQMGDKEMKKSEPRILGVFSNPPAAKPITAPMSDATRLNIGFQAKVESKNMPFVPEHAGILTDVQLNNQAKWSQRVASKKLKASREEPLTERKRTAGGATKAARDAAMEKSKNAITFPSYVPDIKDALMEKFARANIQIGTDLLAARADAKGKAKDVLAVDNRPKRKRNYIRLCKRLTGPTVSLMQKLHGEDCVKLPRSEFYLRQSPSEKEDGAISGLKIETKSSEMDSESGSKRKQRGDAAAAVDASSGLDYNDESAVRMADKPNSATPVIDDGIGGKLRW